MEKTFKTLIKENHKFGKNAYVRGRIAGMMEVICDGTRNGIESSPFVEPVWYTPGVGHVYTVTCEPEQYEELINKVEKHHPGLCVFNYSEE